MNLTPIPLRKVFRFHLNDREERLRWMETTLNLISETAIESESVKKLLDEFAETFVKYQRLIQEADAIEESESDTIEVKRLIIGLIFEAGEISKDLASAIETMRPIFTPDPADEGKEGQG